MIQEIDISVKPYPSLTLLKNDSNEVRTVRDTDFLNVGKKRYLVLDQYLLLLHIKNNF